MNYSEFMKAIWELATSLIQKAKDKGFDILLLLSVVGVLTWHIMRTEKAWDASNLNFKSDIRALVEELKECNAARGRLEVKVAVMDVELQAFKKVFHSRNARR